MATDTKITIIEDSREQSPLSFDGFRDVEVIRRGLKTGDYSLQGYEDRICFERKAIGDAVSTLINGHTRFLKEMERMRDFEVNYILIEHSPSVLYNYCARHGWQNKFDVVIQSLLAYAYHYHCRVRFCKDREDMAKYIVTKAREFLKEKGEQDEIQKNEVSPC
jgi:ERCC4-type nuclease